MRTFNWLFLGWLIAIITSYIGIRFLDFNDILVLLDWAIILLIWIILEDVFVVKVVKEQK